MKNKLIKWLGGYTTKEYNRIERKYQALLDSKSTDVTAKIVNENMFRMLRDLDNYMKDLYGLSSHLWAKKVYNVIRNNLLRIMIRYVHTGSSIIYTFDTTLDGDRQFEKIIEEERNEEELEFILETD